MMKLLLFLSLLALGLHIGLALVMTSGGTSKLIFGYAIPIDLKVPMSINYVHNFQFQYPNVDNASQVSYVQQGARSGNRQRRTVTRKQIYTVIQEMLQNSGLDKSCLLRSVCESSESPILHSGLVGELLQTLLTPYDPYEDSEYGAAWRAGLEDQDCLTLYPLCPRGHTVLDHVSRYYM